MKQTLVITLLTTMLMAFSVSAKAENFGLKGAGLDNKPCEVQLVYAGQGTVLKSVRLVGASKVWEIIAETEKGYRPRTEVLGTSDKVLELLQENPDLLAAMKYSTWGNQVTYTLDTSDFPTNSDIGRLKMVFKLQLTFKNRQLVQVKAGSTAKYGPVPLARSTFECKK